jgi:hypothetical protein
MSVSAFGRYAFGYCIAFAMLAGCGGVPQSQLGPQAQFQQRSGAQSRVGQVLEIPAGTTSALQGGAIAVHANHTASWMDPDAKTKDLLYVTNPGNSDILVYSYPQEKLVGTLTGFYYNILPDGVCTDKNGDVWIVENAAHALVEYKHGGTTPIATLSDPGYYPTICSVDPITGNLAVANKETDDSTPQQGNVAIYAHAQGTPTLYKDSELFQVWFCGYDNKGNLYVDGTKGYSVTFGFASLPKGKKQLTNIALKGGTIYFPGKILWDGKYVAVGDQSYQNKYPYTSGIYETTGAGGKIVGTTPLTGSLDVAGFWIEGNTVIAPDISLENISTYKYPAGGKSTKLLPGCSGASCIPYDAAISVAK